MKQKILLLTLLCCGFIYNTAKANETEPNDTKGAASTLILNGSNSGVIGTATDVDWYKVTTNGDGRIDLTLTVSNSLYCYFAIYDNDGTTLLHQDYTSSTFTYSVDGLAAGTYYLKIFPYYTAQMPAYTIANKLVKPAQANDTEPDSTRAQALTLPLTDSVTGHIGYYYKNHRDTLDVYKVTTNADGILNLKLSVANNQYVYFNLYDNDAKTLLHQDYTSTSFTYSVDGLAAGTYYIKVFGYYTTGFAPYTLSNTLTKPVQANDAEPDSTKAQAIALTPNTSKKGHIGYYYNNHRDTLDVYKIATSADGNLSLKLTVANNQYVYFNLYDNDGTTLLHQDYTSTSLSYNVDGLAKGTYYLKIFGYYTTGFAPYTIADTLTTYNANDKEPNKYAKQASILADKVTTNGHVGFYYNTQRDTVDWHKINYTGPNKGSMTITFKLLPHISDGSTNYTYIQVYQDTAGTPVFNNYFIGTTANVINLTNLTQGYYYVKVFEYYNSQFQAYSINPSYTQNLIADLNLIGYDTLATCGNVNHIKFQPVKSRGSTTVQLYRFGTAYGSAIVVPKNGFANFDNLPTGSYYATAFADGATGTAYGTSDTVVLETLPVNLTTTGVTTTRAVLNWAAEDCAKYFTVRYRKQGTTTWTTKKTTGNVNSYTVTGLLANTQYEWQVATADSANGITVMSSFTASAAFTTKAAAALIADGSENQDDISVNKINNGSLLITPNPASSFFVIHYKSNIQTKLNASLYNVNGKAVWNSGLINSDVLNNKTVAANQFAKGIYYLKIINEQGKVVAGTKVVIAN